MGRRADGIDLDHLTVIINQGKGCEEYVIIEDPQTGDFEIYTVEEYYELMGYEVNAWREI